MQDPNLPPWGTQDRFQAHFIVRKSSDPVPSEYVAKTILGTTGHFGAKKVVGVKWDGTKLADTLNGDSSLNKLISKQTVKDASIFVDPTENGIRIYGKWKSSYDFVISKEMFEIYDKIAGHVKAL